MTSGISGFTKPTFPISQRTVMNMDYILNGAEYIFIDHLLLGCGFGGQGSGIQAVGFSTNPLSSSLFDTVTGYPTVNPSGGDHYSIAHQIPVPTNYPGPYIIDGTGEGQFQVFTNVPITCTTDAAGTGGASGTGKTGTTSNVTINSPSNFTVSSDSGAGWTVRISAITSYIPVTSISNASPAVITYSNDHQFASGDQVQFATTGTLPSPLVAGTIYFVIAAGLTASTFQISTTSGGSPINTTTAGSGSHSVNYSFIALQPGFAIFQTNQNANGNFLGKFGSIRMYREGDKSRLLAGNLTRLPYAQNMATMNPSVMRFMNAIGSSGAYVPYEDHTVRFEQRNLPGKCGLINNSLSPPYTTMSSAGHDIYTLSSAAGMPPSMVHGEVVFCQSSTTSYRAGNFISPQIVSLANPGIATHVAHGYSTGDQLMWIVPITNGNTVNLSAYGMTGLDGCVAPITVIDANTYSIGLDTTLASPKTTCTVTIGASAVVTETGSNRSAGDPVVFTTTGALPTGITAGTQYFATGTITANTYQISTTNGGSALTTSGTQSGTHSTQTGWFGNSSNIAVLGSMASRVPTLNVGSRGAFPVVTTNGYFSYTNFNQVTSGEYNSFFFDKNLGVRSAVNGAYTPGAWIANPSGTGITQAFTGLPIEYAVKIVNEINALYTTQGRTDLWICCPARGLLSLDPDYSDTSNWVIGAAGVVFNGANGFAGLNSNLCCWFQHANETWNPTGMTGFLQRLGVRRYNNFAVNAPFGPSNGNTNTYATLRSCVMAKDIRRAFPNNGRIKLVMGIQAFSSANTVLSNNFLDTDPINTWNVAPMMLHDVMAGAPYLDLGDGTWDTAHLDTNVTLWKGGTAAQQAAARLAYIQGYVTPTVFPAQSTAAYNTIADGYATFLSTNYGPKYYVNYEGGCNGGWTKGAPTYNSPLTQDEADFLVDCFRGPEWAAAMNAFYDHHSVGANKAMPGFYVLQGSPWSFIQGFTDPYNNGVEYGAYNQSWTAIGVRNQQLP